VYKVRRTLSLAYGNFEEKNKILEPSIIIIIFCIIIIIIIINADYNYVVQLIHCIITILHF
jgi:ABC-type Na+ efflux pump permease subunit